MMLLTEEQAAELGYGVLEFLESNSETKDLNIGEWALILCSAIFMLGQRASKE